MRKPDIIWILIDGVRPDKLKSCGNPELPNLFLDGILEQGLLFTKVITAGCNSKMSMHSAFTSLPPALNRMNAYDPDRQVALDPEAVTLTDVLKWHGYTTLRYVDAVQHQEFYDIQQIVPASGFDVWESGGHALLRDTPGHSFDTVQRRSFIELYNHTPGPKFAYLHLLTSHEIYPELVENCTWTSQIYTEGLSVVSEDFRLVWDALERDENTLVVISTDHGVRLDCHLVQDIVENGVNLRDASCRTFCCFSGLGLPSSLNDRMVSNLDIAPTILELAGYRSPIGLGRSLLPVARAEALPGAVAFTENVGGYEIPPSRPKLTNVWGARTERWKYWVHETRGEFLADLEKDPRELVNLIGTGLPVEDELRSLVRERLRVHPQSPRLIYQEHRVRGGAGGMLDRREILPEISVVLLVLQGGGFVEDAIRAVRSQLAVYWELLVVDGNAQDSLAAAVRALDDFRVTCLSVQGTPFVAELLQRCRGCYLAVLTEDMVLAPTALYELKKTLASSPDGALAAECRGAVVYPPFRGKRRVIKEENGSCKRFPFFRRATLAQFGHEPADLDAISREFGRAAATVGSVYRHPSRASRLTEWLRQLLLTTINYLRGHCGAN